MTLRQRKDLEREGIASDPRLATVKGSASVEAAPSRSEVPLRPCNVSLVVCKDCDPPQALFVNGHPRNFCGHAGRGERVEYVPKALADEMAECLTIYDEADHLPHGRVTNSLVAYREAVGE